MKIFSKFIAVSGLLIFFLNLSLKAVDKPAGDGMWKAGIAKAVITPAEPIWLAGYASRTHPSDGILTDLYVRVLAIQDGKGKKAVLITSDLLGFPKKLSDLIRNQIAIKYGLTRSQVILSYSHTHSGPVLTGALFDIYPLDQKQLDVIEKYSDNLAVKIVELAGESLHNMVPAQIWTGSGITRFQVNRRNNREAELTPQTPLSGPNDYAVPVIKVTDASGSLMAVAFGYACHATVLDIYKISGDYPGFAEIEIEKAHPGATAMFFQGAGADQNPLPRRTIPLAQQYGKELAAAVERVLSEEMKKQDPVLKTAYSEIDLPFTAPPPVDTLKKIEREKTGWEKSWATNQLKRLREYGSLLKSYPYPLQVWKVGDQPIMALGGELVVEYSLELKKIYGPGLFVLGYVNDDMAYIPSETILQEGGYEGMSSQMVYGLPAQWKPGLEKKILDEMAELASKVGITPIK